MGGMDYIEGKGLLNLVYHKLDEGGKDRRPASTRAIWRIL